MAELPVESTDPDQLFTATINLMWQLHYAALEHRLQWAADDLLVALSDLGVGPWRHLGWSPDVIGVPFTALGTLLDRMLVELLRVTPGFGARVAIAKAQSRLDPHHAGS